MSRNWPVDRRWSLLNQPPGRPVIKLKHGDIYGGDFRGLCPESLRRHSVFTIGTCRPTGHIQLQFQFCMLLEKNCPGEVAPFWERSARSSVPPNLTFVFHVVKHILTRLKVDKKCWIWLLTLSGKKLGNETYFQKHWRLDQAKYIGMSPRL